MKFWLGGFDLCSNLIIRTKIRERLQVDKLSPVLCCVVRGVYDKKMFVFRK